MWQSFISRFRSHELARSLSGKRGVALVIILAPLIYFWPAVAGQNVLAIGDGWSYSLLLKALCGQLLAQGIFPLWNPYSYGGSPLLAGIQPGALYPPNWLFAIFSPGAAMNLVVITTYHVAMAGMFLYARAIGVTRLGALVSGAIFAFGGFMVSHLDQPNCIGSLAWTPWLLWVIEKIRERAETAETTVGAMLSSWPWVTIGAVIFAAQFFAGHPQSALHVWLMSGAYALFTLLRCERLKAWRFAIAITALTLCGGLLCMVQLLPTRELQPLGQRAALSYEYFSTQPLPPHSFLMLIFPYFFGGGHPPIYRVGGWDSWWLVKWGFGYAGISGITLGLTALAVGKQRRMVWFWIGTIFFSLFLALGSTMPFGIHRLLYQTPIYNLFRSSYRHLFEFNLAIAALAGIGISHLAQMEAANLKRVLIKGLGLASALVVFTTTLYRFFPHRLGAESPPPPAASALTNPEAFIPLLIFAIEHGKHLLLRLARRQIRNRVVVCRRNVGFGFVRLVLSLAHGEIRRAGAAGRSPGCESDQRSRVRPQCFSRDRPHREGLHGLRSDQLSEPRHFAGIAKREWLRPAAAAALHRCGGRNGLVGGRAGGSGLGSGRSGFQPAQRQVSDPRTPFPARNRVANRRQHTTASAFAPMDST